MMLLKPWLASRHGFFGCGDYLVEEAPCDMGVSDTMRRANNGVSENGACVFCRGGVAAASSTAVGDQGNIGGAVGYAGGAVAYNDDAEDDDQAGDGGVEVVFVVIVLYTSSDALLAASHMTKGLTMHNRNSNSHARKPPGTRNSL